MSYMTKMFDNLAKADYEKATLLVALENEKFLKEKGFDTSVPLYAELPKPMPKRTEEEYRNEVKSYAPITLTF